MNILVENVFKTFQDIPVVEDLSFSVESGTVLGLLGPNGAGKTTTLRMILNILRPDEGEITFDGEKINKALRNRIGYLPEERGIYQKYKVIDVFIYLGRLKNLTKRKSYVEAVRLLDRFQMIDYLEEPVSHLSKGLQQKFQFLISIIHNPEMLILDEPFWGLDPLNQDIIRKNIVSMKKEGKLIILSTHQLAEAESLCDYFILIDHGKAVLKGSFREISKNFHHNIISVEAQDNLASLRDIHDIQKVEIKNSRAFVYIKANTSINQVLNEIINTVNISKIEINKPNLNDIFMQTIKR